MVSAQEIDNLHDEKKFKEIYDSLHKLVEEENNEDPEMLWRYARANFDMAQELQQSDKAREPFIHNGRKWAEKAVEIDGSNGLCHKWMAILLSSEVCFTITCIDR